MTREENYIRYTNKYPFLLHFAFITVKHQTIPFSLPSYVLHHACKTKSCKRKVTKRMCLEFALPCLGKPYNMHYFILFVPLHEHDAYTHDKYEVVQNRRKFSVNSLRETKYCEHA